MSGYILTHPDNLADLYSACVVLTEAHAGGFFGMKIVANKYMDRFRSKYQPPRERFFEYDESDHAWLKYFGMGGYVKTKEPLFYRMHQPGPVALGVLAT